MRVRLTQIDGKLPNLALMKLSAYHRMIGDEVVFTRRANRDILDGEFDLVYGSAIFTRSTPAIERFKSEWPGAILGGTGTDSKIEVEHIIGSSNIYDYSIYPEFEPSIGFSQRGCRLSCKFCVVPNKEGKPLEVATINQIWRGPGHPKQIQLLDNDFFGQPNWRDRIAEIRGGKFAVCFNQGINTRLINDEAAEALATVRYMDDQFKKRRLYTAWDNLKDEKIFFDGVDRLERAGVPPRHLMVYMLTGYAKDETMERIEYRFNRMVERGMFPYPMVYDPARKDLKQFQRWVVTGMYRAGIPFSEYDPSAKRQRNTTASGYVS